MTNCAASAASSTPSSRPSTAPPVTPIRRMIGSRQQHQRERDAEHERDHDELREELRRPGRHACEREQYARRACRARRSAGMRAGRPRCPPCAWHSASSPGVVERAPDGRANTISIASRNSSTPPPILKASTLMPSMRSSDSAADGKNEAHDRRDRDSLDRHAIAVRITRARREPGQDRQQRQRLDDDEQDDEELDQLVEHREADSIRHLRSPPVRSTSSRTDQDVFNGQRA